MPKTLDQVTCMALAISQIEQMTENNMIIVISVVEFARVKYIIDGTAKFVKPKRKFQVNVSHNIDRYTGIIRHENLPFAVDKVFDENLPIAVDKVFDMCIENNLLD